MWAPAPFTGLAPSRAVLAILHLYFCIFIKDSPPPIAYFSHTQTLNMSLVPMMMGLLGISNFCRGWRKTEQEEVKIRLNMKIRAKQGVSKRRQALRTKWLRFSRLRGWGVWGPWWGEGTGQTRQWLSGTGPPGPLREFLENSDWELDMRYSTWATPALRDVCFCRKSLLSSLEHNRSPTRERRR